MNVAPISLQFQATNPIIDPTTGKPNSAYGWQFFLDLQQRTGRGTGIFNTVSGPLTATGTTLPGALVLSDDWNLVATAPGGSGVVLPPTMAPGSSCKIRNNGSNPLEVYPPTPLFQINALGAGNPYSLGAGVEIDFECWTTTQLYTH